MNNVLNLQRELEIENLLLNRLRKQRKHISARLSPKGYPEGQSYQDADSIPGRGTMGFSDAIMLIDEINREIDKTLKNIECLERDIQDIEYLVSSLTSLEQKVKYMQLIEGKSLKYIADELGYSYNWIRHVACEVSKKSE